MTDDSTKNLKAIWGRSHLRRFLSMDVRNWIRTVVKTRSGMLFTSLRTVTCHTHPFRRTLERNAGRYLRDNEDQQTPTTINALVTRFRPGTSTAC